MKRIILFLLLGFIISCSTKKKADSGRVSTLSNEEIITIIKIVEENQAVNYDGNYHFMYDTYLNDSTFIISLVNNHTKTSSQDKFSNVIAYKNTHIIVYDSCETLSDASLEFAKKKGLLLEKQQSPFFILHNPYWNLYIEKDKIGLSVKKMEQLLKNQEHEEVEVIIDFKK